MRLIITASGIQEYIFSISQRRASRRLRGRSTRLGLVIDLCHLLLRREFGEFGVRRDAGSRLELEIEAEPSALRDFLDDLRRRLDQHSQEELDAQVWFSVAEGTQENIHNNLALRKLSLGRSLLQKDGLWDESRFTFTPRVNERALVDLEEPGEYFLPDAKMGADLVRFDDPLITLTPRGREKGESEKFLLVNYVAETTQGRAGSGVGLEISAEGSKPVVRLFKHIARHIPLDGRGRALDFDEIADSSTGAKFLGILKADLDNLGQTFETLKEKPEEAQKLSRHLQSLFTEQLESVIKSSEAGKPDLSNNYIIYSGGDDLFMVGPWDKLIRFIDRFQHRVRDSAEKWKQPSLTLSAGFRLAHPKSPVRFLAEDADAALEEAKGQRPAAADLPAKNRFAVFERVLAWDELRLGLGWADLLIAEVEGQKLSAAFLQRMQYYAGQFRRLEKGEIEGLRMVALLQNDWHRNIDRASETLRKRLNNEMRPLLLKVSKEGSQAWRIMDFATRFAIYSIR
jgi:Cas10/Cmr2, second palm domain